MPFQYRTVSADGITFNIGIIPDVEANAPPLLLLNGIGFNAQLMEGLAQSLPGRAIICPEMPGCGKSPAPQAPYAMVCMGSAMIRMMDQLYPDQPFDCLGFSWGGALAQQVAVQAQARVSRLIIVSSTSGVPLPIGDPEVLARLADPLEYIDPQRMRRNFAAMVAEGGAGAKLMRRFATPSPAGVSSQLLALTGWSAAPFLPFIRMPVLLAGLADDIVVPIIHQRVLACLIPQAETHEFQSGGHLMPLAAPQSIAPRLLRFLNTGAEREAI